MKSYVSSIIGLLFLLIFGIEWFEKRTIYVIFLFDNKE
nr:MAG TPA: hypothetical protein [Caudoviricetes sp.]